MSENDELSDHERAAFAALPRERIPPAHLEERVVGALRHEGLLSSSSRRRRGLVLTAAVAAGLALFASGAATGVYLGRGSAGSVVPTQGTDPAARAARVQETGSAYVQAVALLADSEAEDATRDGLEAARAALHAAALELARLRPDDATMRLILAVLQERAAGPGDAGANERRTTFWF